jgi:hypothetical protein
LEQLVLEELCTVIGADCCSGGVQKLLQLLCTSPEQQAAPVTVHNTSRTTTCSMYYAQHLQNNKLLLLLCTTPPEQQAAPITVHNTSRTTGCSNYCAQHLQNNKLFQFCAQHLQNNKLLQLLCTTSPERQAAPVTVHNSSSTISCSNYCAQLSLLYIYILHIEEFRAVLLYAENENVKQLF